jgi:hypothetical protein
MNVRGKIIKAPHIHASMFVHTNYFVAGESEV